ncbi:hypothetical protein ACFXA3_19245 [Streptomyces sp. NPDC059456]|uniref:hypothetical protein n=1 Tax=Streptomyces sp. NPDC059456 TaxID=3346838 RepID=UPI0036B5DAA2
MATYLPAGHTRGAPEAVDDVHGRLGPRPCPAAPSAGAPSTDTQSADTPSADAPCPRR